MDRSSSSSSYTDRGAAVSLSSTVLAKSREELCLIAGVIDENVPAPQKLESDLTTAWRLRGSFGIVEHANNLFKIQFVCEDDLQYIFENRPWVVNNIFIAIQSCEQSSILADEKIYRSLIWVQFRGLPMEHHNPMVAERLGKKVGDANMFHEYQVISKNSTLILRVRVMVDITLPLIHKIKHVIDSKDYGWIRCTYERVHRHCKKCGRIGHIAHDCKWNNEGKRSEAENKLKDRIRGKLHEDIEIGIKEETRGDKRNNATKHTARVQWVAARNAYHAFNDSPRSYGENINDNTGLTVSVTPLVHMEGLQPNTEVTMVPASGVYLRQDQRFPRGFEPWMMGMQGPFEVGGSSIRLAWAGSTNQVCN